MLNLTIHGSRKTPWLEEQIREDRGKGVFCKRGSQKNFIIEKVQCYIIFSCSHNLFHVPTKERCVPTAYFLC